MQFLVEPLFDRGILAQRVPRPRKHLRSGFVSGDEKRHRLVAELLRRHVAAVFIHRIHQQREEIVVMRRAAIGALALGNDAIDERIHEREFLIRAAIIRRGPRLGNAHRHALPAQRIAHQKGHRAADLFGLAGQRGAEKRLHGDVEREPHHVLRHVALFAVAPLRDMAFPRSPPSSRRNHSRVRDETPAAPAAAAAARNPLR